MTHQHPDHSQPLDQDVVDRLRATDPAKHLPTYTASSTLLDSVIAQARRQRRRFRLAVGSALSASTMATLLVIAGIESAAPSLPVLALASHGGASSAMAIWGSFDIKAADKLTVTGSSLPAYQLSTPASLYDTTVKLASALGLSDRPVDTSSSSPSLGAPSTASAAASTPSSYEVGDPSTGPVLDTSLEGGLITWSYSSSSSVSASSSAGDSTNQPASSADLPSAAQATSAAPRWA